MPRFFIDASDVFLDGDDRFIRITGDDAHHGVGGVPLEAELVVQNQGGAHKGGGAKDGR